MTTKILPEVVKSTNSHTGTAKLSMRPAGTTKAARTAYQTGCITTNSTKMPQTGSFTTTKTTLPKTERSTKNSEISNYILLRAEDTLEAFGPEKGRKIVLEWAEKYGLCHKCYKEQQEAELFDFETEHCLPNIKDTAKETAWARRLRKNMLTETFEYTAQTKRYPEIDTFIEWLKGQTDCQFWINNDSKPVKELFKIFREKEEKENSL